MRQEAESAEPIVHGHNNDAFGRQLHGVVVPASPAREAAAVDPYEHRQVLRVTTLIEAGRDNVEVQAVLVLWAKREAARCLRQLGAKVVASRTPCHSAGG